ncbi:Protein BONZAI 3 [Capsicum chinense]|nr:Protein BONZAI 3 [Capsicum chinense]
MGNCLSDVKGGKQAVGGVGHHMDPAAAGDGNGAAVGGSNDAVDLFYRTKGLHALYIPIELSLSASKLSDLDIISKSDPMAVVSIRRRDGTLEELGRTEVIMNNLDPVWVQKISVMYQFETVQTLIFHVYDVDTKYHNIPAKDLKLNDQDFIGEASCVLSEIVTKCNRCLTLNLRNRNGHVRKNLGEITIHAEEIVTSRTAVEMTLRCTNLENKDLFLKNDPFLRISRIIETGGSVPICKTEVVDNNLNPIGVMKSGFDLNFMVVVDFTASNGNPRSPDSLYYIDPSGHLNVYQKAIMEVGDIIQFYDSDKLFPAWGFGGKANSGTVSHCFNLNGSSGASEVECVEGIMDAYSSALKNFTLFGPTLFGHVVNKASEIAVESLKYNHSKYFVLLIITDGVITDMQETIDDLVRASDLPLSILIVGIGGADFSQMEVLDADNGQRLESSTGRVATRDIVQFVPMREVHRGQISVVQALLEELPGQFLTYMRCRDIRPPNISAAQTYGPGQSDAQLE